MIVAALGVAAWLLLPSLLGPTIVLDLQDMPDEAFRTYLAQNVGADGNGAIDQEEADAVTAIGDTSADAAAGNGLAASASPVWRNSTSRPTATLRPSAATTTRARPPPRWRGGQERLGRLVRVRGYRMVSLSAAGDLSASFPDAVAACDDAISMQTPLGGE